MGKIIETPYIAHSELTNEIYIINKNNKYCVTDQVIKAVESTNRAIPKDQYESRLKADMVAMLVDLAKKIEGQCKIPNNCASAYDWNNGVYACYRVIQQEINALKGNQKGEK